MGPETARLAVLVYDLTMRRLFLCILLLTMPLRLLAGAWMPMAQDASHHAADNALVSLAQHSELPDVRDCHESTVQTLPETDAQPAPFNISAPQADCQDGNCQLCGVCHQGLSLTTWPLVMPLFQAHPLPVNASWAHAALMSAPLIKPPIF